MARFDLDDPPEDAKPYLDLYNREKAEHDELRKYADRLEHAYAGMQSDRDSAISAHRDTEVVDDEVVKLKAELAHALDVGAGYKNSIEFMRNECSLLNARPCPACIFNDGVFIRACKLHEVISELSGENSKLRAQLASQYCVSPREKRWEEPSEPVLEPANDTPAVLIEIRAAELVAEKAISSRDDWSVQLRPELMTAQELAGALVPSIGSDLDSPEYLAGWLAREIVENK